MTCPRWSRTSRNASTVSSKGTISSRMPGWPAAARPHCSSSRLAGFIRDTPMRMVNCLGAPSSLALRSTMSEWRIIFFASL